jgi:hypothetical protein
MTDFEDYCRECGRDPDAHLALCRNESDLVPQPATDRVFVGWSKLHGDGVFTLDWIERGQMVGLLTDMQFRRTALIGRFVNHSNHPNTRLAPGPLGMHLVALAPILLADEITIDYRDIEILRKILQKEGL